MSGCFSSSKENRFIGKTGENKEKNFVENQEAKKIEKHEKYFLPSKIEICFYVSFLYIQPSTNISTEKCQHREDKNINKKANDADEEKTFIAFLLL